MFTADKESIGCTAGVSLAPNSDGTQDFCIFQINNEPSVRGDIEHCVKRAWDKYADGRIGTFNFSAWYAVCTTGNNPQPKYEGINCQ